MRIDREVPSEITVQEDVFWRAREPFFSADHMGNSHHVIIHDNGEVIGRVTVALDKDLIIEHVVRYRYPAADHIIE